MDWCSAAFESPFFSHSAFYRLIGAAIMVANHQANQNRAQVPRETFVGVVPAFCHQTVTPSVIPASRSQTAGGAGTHRATGVVLVQPGVFCATADERHTHFFALSPRIVRPQPVFIGLRGEVLSAIRASSTAPDRGRRRSRQVDILLRTFSSNPMFSRSRRAIRGAFYFGMFRHGFQQQALSP
jgi:hypothetical protein